MSVLPITNKVYLIDFIILLLKSGIDAAEGWEKNMSRVKLARHRDRMTLKAFEFRIVSLLAARGKFVPDGLPGNHHF